MFNFVGVVKLLRPGQLLVTSWTVARQTPLSLGFPKQAYWSGLPFPLQGISLTKGSSLGLLHCRWILYQLSYQESLV